MSEDLIHGIFHQFDGENCAHLIKDFFSKRRYNVQFNLHELQNVNAAVVSNTGVSILLLTPESYKFIQSRKMLDLNAIFPNPEFSVVLLFQAKKTKTEIRELLSSRIRDFHKWTILEYQVGSSLYTLGIDIMEIVERSEGWTPAPLLQKFRVWMHEGVKSHKQLLLMFTNPVNDDSNVKVIQGWDGLKVVAERLNPMTYSFIVGDVEPGERKIEVYVNDISFGKALLHVEPQIQEISNLLHSVINPVELLCQCLRIVPSTQENLDRGLHDLLCKNTSSVSYIFDKLNWERFGDSDSIYELPTLLHFGAKYGLKHFCAKLLSLPGGQHALKIKNKDGLLPHQIAQKAGFGHMGLVHQKVHPKSKKEPLYLENPISPFEVKLKEPLYLENPISPFEVKLKDPDNIFKFEPLTPRPHLMNPSSIPMNGTRSSPSQVQLPAKLPRNLENTKSVRSSSDSGISDDPDAAENKF